MEHTTARLNLVNEVIMNLHLVVVLVPITYSKIKGAFALRYVNSFLYLDTI